MDEFVFVDLVCGEIEYYWCGLDFVEFFKDVCDGIGNKLCGFV